MAIGTLAIATNAGSATIQKKQGSAVNNPVPETSLLPEVLTEDGINLAIVSVFSQYGIDWKLYPGISDTLYQIGICESQWHRDAYNPKDTDGRPKYGPLQYDWNTFYAEAAMYHIQNPNIWDAYQQIEVAVLMIKDGKASQWGCYKK